MRAAVRVGFLLALVVSIVTAGCLRRSYPEKQRFVFQVERNALTSVSSPSGAATDDPGESTPGGVLRVDRMRVSRLFERKGFVYRTADDTFENDFYNEFFAAPGELLRKATRSWIESASLFELVIGATDPGEPDWLLGGRVEQLYGDLRDSGAPQAVMAMEFTVIDARSTRLDVVFQKRYAAEAPAVEGSATAILAAWNQALAEILSGLETDLRSELGG